jgi:hypothetical protein
VNGILATKRAPFPIRGEKVFKGLVRTSNLYYVCMGAPDKATNLKPGVPCIQSIFWIFFQCLNILLNFLVPFFFGVV